MKVVAAELVDWMPIMWWSLAFVALLCFVYGLGANDKGILGASLACSAFLGIAGVGSVAHSQNQIDGLTSRNETFLKQQHIVFRNIDGNDFNAVIGSLLVPMEIRKDFNGNKLVVVRLSNGKVAPVDKNLLNYLAKSPVH